MTRYGQALTIARDVGYAAQVALCLANIGHIHHEQGDLDRALAIYEQARDAFQALGDRARTAVLLNNSGGIYQARRDYDRALAYYERALATDREMGHRAGMARELMNIGALYVERRCFTEAEPLLVEAVELLQALGSPRVEGARMWLARARAENSGAR